MRGIERVFAGVLLVAAIATTAAFARHAEQLPTAAVHFQPPPPRNATEAPVRVPTPPRPRVRTVIDLVAHPAAAVIVSRPVSPAPLAPVVRLPAAAPAPTVQAAPRAPALAHPEPRPAPTPPRVLAAATPPPAPPAPAQASGPPYGRAWGHQKHDDAGQPQPAPAAPAAPPAPPAAPLGDADHGRGHAYGHDKQGFGDRQDE